MGTGLRSGFGGSASRFVECFRGGNLVHIEVSRREGPIYGSEQELLHTGVHLGAPPHLLKLSCRGGSRGLHVGERAS